jgi:hypothetical protein
VIGVVLHELVRRAVIDTGNPNPVPSLVLPGAAVIRLGGLCLAV